MSDTKRKLSIYDGMEDQDYGQGPDQAPPAYDEIGSGSNSGKSTPTLNEDLVAAEALTQLNGTPPPTLPLSNLSIEERQHPLVNKVNKVSKHPIVTNAFKYYEDSKRNFPHFNYAAGIVERAAIPVVARIEDNLNTRHMKRLSRKLKKRKIIKDKNETKKRLQFCLHILRLANDQINTQVNKLQHKIVERERRISHSNPQSPTSPAMVTNNTTNHHNIIPNITTNDNDNNNDNDNDNEKVENNSNDVNIKTVVQTPTPTESINDQPINDLNEPLNDTTADAQKTNTEIITTVKKIIHVISNFKTSTLTNEATNESNELKSTIRDIILKLPSQVQQTNNQNNSTSNGSQQTNDRIFLLAKESLEMISRLTNVFNEQLQKAEDWINSDELQKKQREKDGSDTPVPENHYEMTDHKVQSK